MNTLEKINLYKNYLGTSVNVFYKETRQTYPLVIENNTTSIKGGITLTHLINNDNFMLCLRPLSDLTKEIEANGEKFVPIEVIGHMIDKNYVNLYDDENGSVVGYGERIGCGCPYDCDCGKMARDFILKYNQEQKYFYSKISMDADYDNIIGEDYHPSYDLIQKLYEWHFAINIPEGEYINIKHLK